MIDVGDNIGNAHQTTLVGQGHIRGVVGEQVPFSFGVFQDSIPDFKS
jgi:hypothetical protein